MRRPWSAVLSVLIVATPFLISTPQQAAASAWECDPGYSCYYTGSSGTGSRWVAPYAGCYYPLESWLRDNISSVTNRGHSRAFVHLYNWVGHWEEIATIAPGNSVSWGSGVYANNKTDFICIDS
ncbi:peptidase inhibitor family I36 protein [Nonomuraea sp. NPDC002799]